MLLTRLPPHFGINIVNPLIRNFPRISGSFVSEYLANDSPATNPAVRINNSDNRVELSLDVPGIKASDLKVNIEHQVLTISGNRTVSSENLTSNWRFSRQFALEATVDTSNLTANLTDGVLTVSAPKAAKKNSIDITITEKALGDQEVSVASDKPVLAGHHISPDHRNDAPGRTGSHDGDLVVDETAMEEESLEHDKTRTKA